MSKLTINKLGSVLAVFLFMGILATSAMAGFLGDAGIGISAGQEYEQRKQQIEMNNVNNQRVQNCINSCGQDGNCQAACIAAGNSQMNGQPNNYQYTQPKRVDSMCMSDCTSKGYMYQLCQNHCSY